MSSECTTALSVKFPAGAALPVCWQLICAFCGLSTLVELLRVSHSLRRVALLPRCWKHIDAATWRLSQDLPSDSVQPPAMLQSVRSLRVEFDIPSALDFSHCYQLRDLTLTCRQAPGWMARGPPDDDRWLDSGCLLTAFSNPLPFQLLLRLVLDNVWCCEQECEWVSVFNNDATPALSSLSISFAVDRDSDGLLTLLFTLSRSFFVGLSTLAHLSDLRLDRLCLGEQNLSDRVSLLPQLTALVLTIAYWDCDEVVDWPSLLETMHHLNSTRLIHARISWCRNPVGLREIFVDGTTITTNDSLDHEHSEGRLRYSR